MKAPGLLHAARIALKSMDFHEACRKEGLRCAWPFRPSRERLRRAVDAAEDNVSRRKRKKACR